MRKDKEKALKLRRLGKSYKEIRTELGTPVATLSDWFKNEPWSQEIKNKLSIEASLANPRKRDAVSLANRERWEGKRQEHRLSAIREFEHLKHDPLFLSGIMLYCGEGEKQPKSSVVRLGNSEPEMIRIFNLFLTRSLGISPFKISASLLLYPDLVDSVQKNFWGKAAGLTNSQFKKSVYIKGRPPKKRLSYGVCTIFISSRALKERMLKWLELYQDFLRSHALILEKRAKII